MPRSFLRQSRRLGLLTTSQIRDAFLEYFEKNGHRRVTSSSLVPAGDPTLLFTNAGMNQFKDTFLGREPRDYNRATTSQKCVRAGGKHNDLENVGRTARHHTFFEMLGNFSFGDYFKEDAIRFAWELSLEGFGLEPDRIWATVFEQDDEAARIWRNFLPAERIIRRGRDDNFWWMGVPGPGGPCSELYYDRGPKYGDAEGFQEGDRVMEYWNLVFTEFQVDEHGEPVTHLPQPNVDTGLGLERLAAILQDVPG